MAALPSEPISSTSSSLWKRGLEWGFRLSVAATIVTALVIALIPRSTAFDLGSAPFVEHIGGLVNGADFDRPIPDDCVLRQKGKVIERVADAASVGESEGRYFIDAEQGVVLWSSTHDARERPALFAYSLVAHPTGIAPLERRVLVLLLPALLMFLLGVSRSILLPAPKPDERTQLRQRIFVTAACIVCLLAALVPGWNRLISAPDSNSYLTHSEMRTPLVPYWLDAFALQSPGTTPHLFDELGVIDHWGGSHPLIAGVRAWKFLLVAGIGLLVWELSASFSWWALGSFVSAGAACDVALGHWSRGLFGYLDVVLSEGLSHALTFVCLALVAGYLRKPRWTRGLLIALTVNLLLLARPGNLPFLAVFGLLALFHLVRDGAKVATLRAGTFGAVTAAGILLHCSVNYATHGHFKQHAFTGFNLVTTALQLATPEDVSLFDEPELRDLVRICTVDLADKRSPELTDAAATQNCWQVACPAYSRVFSQTVFADPYAADEVFTDVAHTLIRAHSSEFASMVAGSFTRGFWSTWRHLPLLGVIAASLVMFARTKAWPYLFTAWMSALPFLLIAPCCLTNTPLDRYRSQVLFAEVWAVPLFVTACAVEWSRRRRMESSDRLIGTETATNQAKSSDPRLRRAAA